MIFDPAWSDSGLPISGGHHPAAFDAGAMLRVLGPISKSSWCSMGPARGCLGVVWPSWGSYGFLAKGNVSLGIAEWDIET